jgi:hypothetical protein
MPTMKTPTDFQDSDKNKEKGFFVPVGGFLAEELVITKRSVFRSFKRYIY